MLRNSPSLSATGTIASPDPLWIEEDWFLLALRSASSPLPNFFLAVIFVPLS
jgi:hypothetical protein